MLSQLKQGAIEAKHAAAIELNAVLLFRKRGENQLTLPILERLKADKAVTQGMLLFCDHIIESIHIERRFQRKAIELFNSALQKGKIDTKYRPSIYYLLGELYRRIGDYENASVWYMNVLNEPLVSEQDVAFAERALALIGKPHK